MPRKSTKTEVKATETAIESKVEDIKTEDKATETKVAEETTTGRKKAPAKKTAPKAEETKGSKEISAKASKETDAKEADGKEAGAKASRNAAKKEAKSSVQIQYAGKAYTLEELERIVRDIWKEDLKQKAGDLQNIEMYVKPEENKVYYVMNGEHKGSFDI